MATEIGIKKIKFIYYKQKTGESDEYELLDPIPTKYVSEIITQQPVSIKLNEFTIHRSIKSDETSQGDENLVKIDNVENFINSLFSFADRKTTEGKIVGKSITTLFDHLRFNDSDTLKCTDVQQRNIVIDIFKVLAVEYNQPDFEMTFHISMQDNDEMQGGGSMKKINKLNGGAYKSSKKSSKTATKKSSKKSSKTSTKKSSKKLSKKSSKVMSGGAPKKSSKTSTKKSSKKSSKTSTKKSSKKLSKVMSGGATKKASKTATKK
jgi:hypothetical protein